MNVLVVGYGSIGKRHVANAMALGHSVRVYDDDSVALAHWLADYPTVDRNRPPLWAAEAVIIATPAAGHLRWMRWAAGGRLPFLAEKPLGTLDQIDAVRAFVDEYCGPAGADACRPVAAVGYNLRFHPVAQAFHGFCPVADGVRYHMACDMRTWPGAGARAGDPLLECSHEIDLALWNGCGALVNAAVRTDNAYLTFEGGSVDLEWQVDAYCRRWRADGPFGECRVEFDDPTALGADMYVDELRTFLDAASHPAHGATWRGATLVDGLRVMNVCAQARAHHGG